MQVIAFANQKGGVGKTSTAVNLAAVLGQQGERVLLIDLDPQGSASVHFGVRDSGLGLLERLTKKSSLTDIVQTVSPGVDLVPAGPALSAAEHKFPVEDGWEKRLTGCLESMPETWDWIFLDCPSGRGVLSMNVLTAAAMVQIPVETNPLSLPVLSKFCRTLDLVKAKSNPSLEILGLLPCRAHPRRLLHRKTLEALNTTFPGKVAPVVIRESVALAEAPGHGKPVISYAPRSIGTQDYQAAAKWFKKMAKPS